MLRQEIGELRAMLEPFAKEAAARGGDCGSVSRTTSSLE